MADGISNVHSGARIKQHVLDNPVHELGGNMYIPEIAVGFIASFVIGVIAVFAFAYAASKRKR